MTMHPIFIAVVVTLTVAAANVWAQATVRPPCDGTCGVVQSIVAVTERQVWTPLGSVAPGSLGVAGASGLSGTSTQFQIGPGFTNQGMVVIGAAGGAVYAQKPNDYRRRRWDVTLKLDNGLTRVVSMSFEPLMIQDGDYVRVSGNNIEQVNP